MRKHHKLAHTISQVMSSTIVIRDEARMHNFKQRCALGLGGQKGRRPGRLGINFRPDITSQVGRSRRHVASSSLVGAKLNEAAFREQMVHVGYAERTCCP